MSVLLLGTGAADGWPNAFCRCDSCRDARHQGDLRGQTSALVDGHVLLDCGPSTPEAAARAGVDLAGVDLVLYTHGHSDHFSPAVLLHRSWVQDRPLTVAGPPDVIAAARHWVAPEAAITWRPVRPGDAFETAGVAVRVLASSHRTHLGTAEEPDAVLFDVRASHRLLWATDTGPLPEATVEAVREVAFDVVCLEQTFGDREDLAGAGHLWLGSFAEQVRRLREVGSVTDATDVVAVHLSHHNPPRGALAQRVAAVGARIVPDGTVLRP